MSGDLNVQALRGALTEILSRHEALRTSFTADETAEWQVIHEPELPWRVIETPLPTNEPESRDAAIREILHAEASAAIDLEDGPLFACTLLRLAPSDHVLSVRIHHIAVDEAAVAIIGQELSDLYSSHVTARRPIHAPVPLDGASSSDSAEATNKSLSFWRSVLGGVDPNLDLPRESAQSTPVPSAALVRSTLSGALLSRIGSQLEDVTTDFLVLISAWAMLLSRYTGQEAIVIGTPVTARADGCERTVAYLTDTVPLVVDLSGDPSVTELLSRTRDRFLDALDHRDCSYSQVVGAVGDRDARGNVASFGAWFAVSEGASQALFLDGLECERLTPPVLESKFDLSLVAAREGSNWTLEFEYRRDVYNVALIQGFASSLDIIISEIAADPGRCLSSIGLLTPAGEREMVVRHSVGPALLVDEVQTLHGVFESQAQRTATAPAVTARGRTITYAELSAWSDVFALALRARGVAQGHVVPIFFQRDVESLVALLAVLKSGAAYVMVDRSLPVDRQSLMLRDNQSPVVLVSGERPELLLDGKEILRPGSEVPGKSPDVYSWSAVSSHALAYVTFTSGSTGVPKGIAMPHKPIVNLLIWQREHYSGQLSSDCRTLQFASLAFDQSVLDLFGAWICGGHVILIGEEERATAHQLLTFCAAHKIARVSLPAPVIEVAADALAPPINRLAALTLISGSEEFRVTAALKEFAAADNVRVHNEYGPSETHVASCFDLPVDPGCWPAKVSIGRPIANVSIYVLDERLRVMPVGAAGDLYVGGAAVADGYAGQPRETASRFLADPFCATPGARMYRTGDRARWQGDGNLAFLGRDDFQVKVRGHRVELGDIETCLTAHPEVKAAVVVPAADGSAALVAYVQVVESGVRRSLADVQSDLRLHIAKLLPDYMHPRAIGVLQSFPLTQNGKLDRDALPAAEQFTRVSAAAHRTACSETERDVVAIWSGLLRISEIDVTDDFFKLGGDSLTAARAVAALNARFNIKFPLRALFEARTVEKVAREVESTLQEGAGAKADPGLSGRGAGAARLSGDAPLSYAQERMWFLDRLFGGLVVYNIGNAVRLRGALDADRLRSSVDRAVERQECLRSFFPTDQGKPVTRVASQVLGLTSLVELSDLSDAMALVDLEWSRAFSLTSPPLVRFGLIRVGPDDHLFWFVAHHAVFDGMSSLILAREISHLYSGTEAKLPELLAQYSDYAVWQHGAGASAAVAEELEYWKVQLEGMPEVVSLPTDFDRRGQPSLEGSSVPVRLPASTVSGLQRIADEEGATFYMASLAVFKVLLRACGAGDDIVVGTPTAGRVKPEFDQIIGLFANTLILRTDLRTARTFRHTLRQVRDTVVGALDHQSTPFEVIVDGINPKRDLRWNPLVQVMFHVLTTGGSFSDSLDLEGVASEALHPRSDFAHLDLAWYLEIVGGDLVGSASYSADVFRRETVESLVSAYGLLLRLLAAEPDKIMDDLDIDLPPELTRTTSVSRTTVVASGGKSTAGPEPPDATLELVAEAWRDVLELSEVSLDGDFFDLGGRSLLAVQLVARLRRDTGRDLPLSAVFETPTVRGLARALAATNLA